jgi:hypothetical protein
MEYVSVFLSLAMKLEYTTMVLVTELSKGQVTIYWS